MERALISVSDKTGVVEFARGLAEQGVEILSTGGTARALREAGVPVVDVSEYTGSPEILDGRVKTLHPKIHGGILGRRDLETHRRQVAEQGIGWIDLVCVNLYPFGEVTARGCSEEEAIENIDIGGPSMIRSAAKNHADVVVVVDPGDYGRVLEQVRQAGTVGPELRRELAVKAFRTTAAYDGMIADYLGRRDGERFGATIHQQWHLVRPLRYGENPHQEAAFYREPRVGGPSVATARVLQGKELSYNNIVDANAALELVLEFDEPACVAIKHTNPCGAAIGSSALEAFEKAKRCDPVSIFGGIVALNRPVDLDTARALAEVFLEIVIAPAFEPRALELYSSQKKLRGVRLLEIDTSGRPAAGLDMKRVLGGLLVQTRDERLGGLEEARLVTKRAPTEEEKRAMEFAWKVCKHVKSNAIVLARADHVVGVGAGQMSRVDAARIAVARAREHGLETAGAAVASDAFFPFRDGLDVCAQAGATAVIQPGGSIRDEEVIAAADEHGMAMVMTGVRHFRH
ncbi:MAG: bifunctional phosphoribosylaminoimidazolecarboxamide formyltransferase/IMP cyclohydrolase PurH [Candidatus Dadabacteria bacterium]|nr:MAG: bifunctional phosphoribosylaminoimidazolecarboxamide formyltransferase/IMP cyclohydrolase PurH [Candidatus Dadabacteria bacterium]